MTAYFFSTDKVPAIIQIQHSGTAGNCADYHGSLWAVECTAVTNDPAGPFTVGDVGTSIGGVAIDRTSVIAHHHWLASAGDA